MNLPVIVNSSTILEPFQMFLINIVHDIYPSIFKHVDFASLVNIRHSCSLLHYHVDAYIPRRLAWILSAYCTDTTTLMKIMSSTGSFITGRSTLAFIFPEIVVHPSSKNIHLTIACKSVSIPELLQFFQSDGYENDYALMSAEDYPSCLLLFNRDLHKFVSIIHDSSSPLFLVPDFSYTAFMNAISPQSYAIFYPALTFNKISLAKFDVPSYIMNWRTCEDERLMDAQHFLMNYRFTFLDSEHSRTNNCPKTGCRTYRKSNDNQNLHFHIGNVDNCSSCSTTIMWHLGGRNCLSSQEPFYAHSIAIV